MDPSESCDFQERFGDRGLKETQDKRIKNETTSNAFKYTLEIFTYLNARGQAKKTLKLEVKKGFENIS